MEKCIIIYLDQDMNIESWHHLIFCFTGLLCGGMNKDSKSFILVEELAQEKIISISSRLHLIEIATANFR